MEVSRETKLLEEFGLTELDPGELPIDHHFVRRKIIFSARTREELRSALTQSGYYVLTGIMPSSDRIHLGTMAVVESVKCFSSKAAFTVLLVADLESLATRNVGLEEGRRIALENHIPTYLALGIDPQKTIFYFQSENIDVHKIAADAAREITLSEFRAVYGNAEPSRIVSSLYQIGDVLFPQLVYDVPGIIPVGLDQDPHLRLARDYVRRTPYFKFRPIIGAYIRDVPSLKGEGKMSKSDPYSAIFIPEEDLTELKRKVFKAFSGGREPIEVHRRLGANLEVDVPYQILRFLLRDDSELSRIETEYGSGRMLSGEIKDYLFNLLRDLMRDLRDRVEQCRELVKRGEVRFVKNSRELKEAVSSIS
ncbi:MAG: tryptophan--tRNA ligase [Thaumarchaeota archaeon]|nr:tryptophan--tRNA ligase [Candidatus Calditenuaceae archaeon]MDW8186621.1 tryptophan--tRNA ligase [Nitrososphaerota archaeon]